MQVIVYAAPCQPYQADSLLRRSRLGHARNIRDKLITRRVNSSPSQIVPSTAGPHLLRRLFANASRRDRIFIGVNMTQFNELPAVLECQHVAFGQRVIDHDVALHVETILQTEQRALSCVDHLIDRLRRKDNDSVNCSRSVAALDKFLQIDDGESPLFRE